MGMRLPQRQILVRVEPVRESKAVVDAFKALCLAKGWSLQAGLREIVHDFMDRPYQITSTAGGKKDGYLPGWKDGADKKKALTVLARKHGLTVSELIRRIVRLHLEENSNA